MLFRDVITLVQTKETLNDRGFVEVTDVNHRDVFADRVGVWQAEFYAAQQQNVNLVARFRLRVADYEGEKHLIYQGVRYYVVRTYSDDGEYIELSCADKNISYAGGVKNL